MNNKESNNITPNQIKKLVDEMKKINKKIDLRNPLITLSESITGDIDMDFGRTNYSKDDYINNVGNTVEDAIEFVKDKIADVTIDFAKISKEDVDKIAKFLQDTFGTTRPSLNKDNAEKLAKALGLNSVLSEGFKEGENIAVKIIGAVKVVLGINQYAFMGLVTSGLMGSFFGAPGFIIALVGGWVLLSLFNKILEKFGYGDENTDVAGIGHYDARKDIRVNESHLRDRELNVDSINKNKDLNHKNESEKEKWQRMLKYNIPDDETRKM